jgi:hypothetical protein
LVVILSLAVLDALIRVFEAIGVDSFPRYSGIAMLSYYICQ